MLRGETTRGKGGTNKIRGPVLGILTRRRREWFRTIEKEVLWETKTGMTREGHGVGSGRGPCGLVGVSGGPVVEEGGWVH